MFVLCLSDVVLSHSRSSVSLTTVSRAPHSVPRNTIAAPRASQDVNVPGASRSSLCSKEYQGRASSKSGCECPGASRSSVCSKKYQGRASSKFQVVDVPCAWRSSRQRMVPRLAGKVPDPATDAWTYLITVCTGFVFKNSDNAAAKFDLQAFGPIYTWITNPTSEALVKKIAALEGGTAVVAVSYGHAAQLLAFSNILQPGDHFIATDKIYGGTYTQLGRQFNGLVGRSRSEASKTLRVDTAVPTRFATKLPLRVWFVLCVMFSRLFCAFLLLAFGQDVQL